MSETLTFATYNINERGADDVYAIGKSEEDALGVIPEMAVAFGHNLTDEPDAENLGELIGKVGPAKELQQNIAGVQEVLGTDSNAIAIARSWAERSGLLVPVEHSYIDLDTLTGPVDLAVITGGVRNWMVRRAARLKELDSDRGVNKVLLVGGNRVMSGTEGEDVEEGMTEFDYMIKVLTGQLADMGLAATNVRAESSKGNEVKKIGAERASKLINIRRDLIAVVSNAGAWVQNAGQFWRAMHSVDGRFDIRRDQFLVVSDSFPLGTGAEPTSTHQNPFSAAGQIVRNAQELVLSANP